MNTKLLRLLVWPAFSFGVLMQAEAATLYLSFANSGGASGSLNGTSFSGASWTLEYLIDDSVLDGSTDSERGFYVGAVTGANLMLDGISYTLSFGSDAGNLNVSSYSTAYDGVSINPTSGGFLQFITDYGTTFPALFSDVNSLSSANLGTTVYDVTTDPFNNQSIIYYQFPNSIYTLEGDTINISESSGPASGNFSVTISGTSSVASVPVPAAVWLFGSGLLGLVGIARRKKAA